MWLGLWKLPSLSEDPLLLDLNYKCHLGKVESLLQPMHLAGYFGGHVFLEEIRLLVLCENGSLYEDKQVSGTKESDT